MTNNYAKIVDNNLEKLFQNLAVDLVRDLPGEQDGEGFVFEAFGEKCEIQPHGIFLGGVKQTGVVGILISLYAIHAQPDPCLLEPLKSFKDLPDSMPYAGAFVTHTQEVLVPHVDRIENNKHIIMEHLRGQEAPGGVGGDFSFVVYPLPKIALCYIFYQADDDFPASATCLYSNNAHRLLPIDALADVGEYTSRKILSLVN